jgi:hypothetical protein
MEKLTPYFPSKLAPFILTQDPDPTSCQILSPSPIALKGSEGIRFACEVVHGGVA